MHVTGGVAFKYILNTPVLTFTSLSSITDYDYHYSIADANILTIFAIFCPLSGKLDVGATSALKDAPPVRFPHNFPLLYSHESIRRLPVPKLPKSIEQQTINR